MIKKQIKITLVFAIVVVVLSQVFLGLAMPVLNFMSNPIDDKPTDKKKNTVIVHGDEIINMDDPNLKPSTTEDPSETPQPIIYKPGEVLESTIVKASSISFEKGSKNILLLGINTEEGNTDTIFVLNIDTNNHIMKLVSIPRDTYVPHSQATQDAMKEDGFYYSKGSFKINAVQYIGDNIIEYTGGKFGNSGVDYLCAVISQLLPGCEIDEYVYVDFDGFVDIIDILGGVYVDVYENIRDEYGNLRLAQGYRKLSGKDALTFVRYRYQRDETGKLIGTGGDSFRKTNQANFLASTLGQVFTAENLSVDKVVRMMDSLKSSVHHSFTVSDIPTYIDIGKDYMNGLYSVAPFVIRGVDIDPFGDRSSYVTFN